MFLVDLVTIGLKDADDQPLDGDENKAANYPCNLHGDVNVVHTFIVELNSLFTFFYIYLALGITCFLWELSNID